MKNILTGLGLMCALGLGAVASAATSPARPNIIFILADDYGVGEVSCYGADNYRTPNIDALARGGTRFTHAYTPSLCGPSRATILTGRYLFRTGATNQDATGRFTPQAEPMMPGMLKPAASNAASWQSSAVGQRTRCRCT